MAKWTFDNIPDQSGRVALVTGAPSGIRFHISRMLVQKGAEAIVTYRDFEKAEAAAKKIVAEFPEAKLFRCSTSSR